MHLELGARWWTVLATRGLAAVLCAVASAGPAAAQTDHANLEDAVTAFTEDLVLRGNLREHRVLVDPREFFEQGSRRRLPLSEFLSEQFTATLPVHGVTPVAPGGNEDEDRMMVLRGRWRLLDEGLHLTVRVMQPIADGSGTVATARPARVKRFDERLLDPDIGFLERDLVRQLDGGVRDRRHRTVHVGEFLIEVEDVDNPERVRNYLMARLLRRAFARSRLFTLRTGVPREGEGDGVLGMYVYPAPEHLELNLHVDDSTGGQVTYASVDVPKALLPQELMGAAKPAVPPVEPKVACREVCDWYDNVKLGNLANSGGTVFRCNSNSSFSCRHQNGYLETIDWDNRGWTSADRVRIFYKTHVAPDNYAGISINGNNLRKGGFDYGCKYNSLALSCCRNVPEGCN